MMPEDKISMEKIWKLFYLISRMHQKDSTEEIKWLNVQNAEPKFQNQRKHGKWQVVQIKLENVCN